MLLVVFLVALLSGFALAASPIGILPCILVEGGVVLSGSPICGL